MTAVTDMKQVMELVLERTMTASALTRIGIAAYARDPHSVVATGVVPVVDEANPTNEEMAEVIRHNIKINWQQILGNDADIASDETASASREANRATAVADME